MDGLIKKTQQTVGGKAKKGVRKIVVEEPLETLKSAKTQLFGEQKLGDQVQSQEIQKPSAEVSQEEEAKMDSWRRKRLQELEVELNAEASKTSRKANEWKENQAKLMEGDEVERSKVGGAMLPESPRKGMGRVERKQRKIEMGKGPTG